MYLKKLEMLGFKSFADRTELVFQPGMTAVVGPNGCGKSNVVDAFKWIFGEQSAKGLRGSEMKDVIFNGTQERKPVGFAEVTIVFENSDRFLDIDYSEVAITRRLYRSGESEYLINKQRARLKDIRGLFMGTGIGQTSYSILEQGKIDVLLQSSNIDRRFIFEEAAGISKYLAKKGETLRALLRVEENLTRLNDIVDEVEKRLQRVKAQASRARRYRELNDRLKALRVRAAIEDYGQSVNARADLSFRLHWADSRERRIQGLVAEVSSVLDLNAAERREAGERARTARDELAAERLGIERTLERIEQERRRSGEMAEEEKRKEEDAAQTRSALRVLEERLGLERGELEALAVEIGGLRAEFQKQVAALENARGERERIEGALRAGKDGLVASIQERSRISNGIIQIESEISNLLGRKERLDAALSGFRAQRDRELARQAAEVAGIEALRAGRRELEDARCGVEESGAGIQGALDALERDLAANVARANQLRSRHDVLEGLERNLEGVGRGVADILRRREADGGQALAEVHGMVASLIDVASAHARAVEAALGVHAQSLVVETEDGAIGLLDFARSEKVGAVEVISLDRVDRIPLEHFPRQAGVLGALREKVKAPDELSDLFDRLLANVVLVEDFETALALSRNGLRPFRLVTLSGEVIEPWGALSIAGENEIGLISRRSEMEDLLREAARLESEGDALRGEASSLRQSLAANRAEVDRLRAEAASLDLSIAEKQGSLAQVARELDRLERELAVGASEREEIESEAAARALEKQALDREAALADAGRIAAEEEIRRLETEAGEAAKVEAALSDALAQSRIDVAQREKREEALREMVERQETSLAERRDHLALLEDGMAALGRRRLESEETLRANEADLVRAREREAALDERFQAGEAEERRLVEREEAIRVEIESLRKEAARYRGERETAQLADQEERHRRNTLVERMAEEYGVDLAVLFAEREAGGGTAQPGAAPADPGAEAPVSAGPAAEAAGQPTGTAPDREAAREEIREIQEKLRRLGGVNLEALDELEELEERHRFQLAQRTDLLESEKNLRGIIAEINRTSREMFLKTFEDVQRHFSDLFRKCFEGGKAELVLEEGADVLEAGIDIIAKPPGKKITSLSLMSGGEKTMTTLALLFAIFRARPSPFCILDEVDAPLDETNVRRFVVLLQDFLAQTQFVVVTHNKISMAEANTLYGITMQEHGVSKRVSVELETYDPEKLAAAV
jgi:chromosome segregation protein